MLLPELAKAGRLRVLEVSFFVQLSVALQQLRKRFELLVRLGGELTVEKLIFFEINVRLSYHDVLRLRVLAHYMGLQIVACLRLSHG